MSILNSDRLTLRMLRESDFEADAEMCADPNVMRYIGDGQPLDRAYGRNYPGAGKVRLGLPDYKRGMGMASAARAKSPHK
jgi:hypothetical protein